MQGKWTGNDLDRSFCAVFGLSVNACPSFDLFLKMNPVFRQKLQRSHRRRCGRLIGRPFPRTVAHAACKSVRYWRNNHGKTLPEFSGTGSIESVNACKKSRGFPTLDMPRLEIDYIHSTMINKGEIFVFFSLSITFNSARNVACLHDGINIVTLFLADIISNFKQFGGQLVKKM